MTFETLRTAMASMDAVTTVLMIGDRSRKREYETGRLRTEST